MCLRENFILALPGMLPLPGALLFKLLPAADRAFASELSLFDVGMSICSARANDERHNRHTYRPDLYAFAPIKTRPGRFIWGLSWALFP